MGDAFVSTGIRLAQQPVYRYNPYIREGSCTEYLVVPSAVKRAFADGPSCSAPPPYQGQTRQGPHGSSPQGPSLLPPPYSRSPRRGRHAELLSYIQHFTFPQGATPQCPADELPKSALARLFIGQLPYSITDEQLNFAIAVATGGIVLQHVERIVIWKKNRAPTGCVHAYCLPSEVDAVLSAHQRVLFDDDGVWVAQCADDLAALKAYAATQLNGMLFRLPFIPIPLCLLPNFTDLWILSFLTNSITASLAND